MTLRGDRCQCKACGEFFNSTYAFDRHRRGPYTDRRCLTPLAMSGEGFEKNSGGFWITGRKIFHVAPAADSPLAAMVNRDEPIDWNFLTDGGSP